MCAICGQCSRKKNGSTCGMQEEKASQSWARPAFAPPAESACRQTLSCRVLWFAQHPAPPGLALLPGESLMSKHFSYHRIVMAPKLQKPERLKSNGFACRTRCTQAATTRSVHACPDKTSHLQALCDHFLCVARAHLRRQVDAAQQQHTAVGHHKAVHLCGMQHIHVNSIGTVSLELVMGGTAATHVDCARHHVTFRCASVHGWIGRWHM